MKKFILIFISILLVGCGATKVTQTKYYNSQVTKRYGSLKDMINDATLVAKVKIKDDGSSNKSGKYVYTTYQAKVEDGLKNADASTIKIKMRGGVDGSTRYIVKDDPLMKKGEEYLVFATKNNDGTYTTLSDAFGRMQIKNDLVTSLNVANNEVEKTSQATDYKVNALGYDVMRSQIENMSLA